MYKTTMQQQDHKQLALAAVMFFGFMVNNLLKENTQLSDKQRYFVQSYIYYWYITTIAGIVSIVLIIAYYFHSSYILYWLHSISIIVTIVLLLVGSIGVISGTIIYHSKNNKQNMTYQDKSILLLNFLPIYNRYQRYKIHNFENPDNILKESLILRNIRWRITLITQSKIISIVILLYIVVRVATLLWWIDFINQQIIEKSKKLFKHNPEEIRWYIIATVIYVKQKIQKNIMQFWWEELLQKAQKRYSYMLPINQKSAIPYIITLAIISIVSTYNNLYTQRTWRLPIAIMIINYSIIYHKRKHLPTIPIIHDIYNITTFKKTTTK